MSYRVELGLKFLMDWRSNIKTLFFAHFLQKKCDTTPYEKIKNWPKFRYPKIYPEVMHIVSLGC